MCFNLGKVPQRSRQRRLEWWAGETALKTQSGYLLTRSPQKYILTLCHSRNVSAAPVSDASVLFCSVPPPQSDGVQQTTYLAQRYCHEAVREISKLRPSPERDALIQLSEIVLTRDKWWLFLLFPAATFYQTVPKEFCEISFASCADNQKSFQKIISTLLMGNFFLLAKFFRKFLNVIKPSESVTLVL